MQIDPLKPTLKAPDSNRLKLEHEKTLSNFTFTFNLRRFSLVAKALERAARVTDTLDGAERERSDAVERTRAGAYTRPLSSST